MYAGFFYCSLFERGVPVSVMARRELKNDNVYLPEFPYIYINSSPGVF